MDICWPGDPQKPAWPLVSLRAQNDASESLLDHATSQSSDEKTSKQEADGAESGEESFDSENAAPKPDASPTDEEKHDDS